MAFRLLHFKIFYLILQAWIALMGHNFQKKNPLNVEYLLERVYFEGGKKSKFKQMLRLNFSEGGAGKFNLNNLIEYSP